MFTSYKENIKIVKTLIKKKYITRKQLYHIDDIINNFSDKNKER